MDNPLQSYLNYLKFEKRYSEHTLSSYTSDLEQFIAFLAKYDQSDVTAVSHLDVRNWVVEMMEQKLSARTINRKISVLKSLYKFMMQRGIIARTPMTKVQSPKMSKRLPVFVEKTGVERLVHQVEYPDGYEGALHKIIIELLYGTGMRRSELASLKQSDIDPYNLQIKVTGKGNKQRIIPIHPNLSKAVLEYTMLREQSFPTYKGGNLLLSEDGLPIKHHFIYTTVKKYLDLVTTVNKRSPHVLRHTFATHLMNNGADINAVKELLGHSSLAATQVYTHNTIDKLKDVYKRAHPKA